MRLTKKREGAAFEIVDLRDYPMPLFDERVSPLRAPPTNEIARKWAAKVGELDGFVFVTGEYNHGIPAALKNALDFVYGEWNRKAAGYVAYGSVGGARAVEQLRMNLIELQIAPVRAAVHIARPEFMDILMHGKTLDDFPHLAQAAETMLDDLMWWASALRNARSAA